MAKRSAKGTVPDITLHKPVHKKKPKKGFSQPLTPDDYCQYCGSRYGLERHHIVPKGMGGTNDEAIHSEENKIILCKCCHKKAQEYFPGYMPDDLLLKKEEDVNRRKEYDALIGAS